MKLSNSIRQALLTLLNQNIIWPRGDYQTFVSKSPIFVFLLKVLSIKEVL